MSSEMKSNNSDNESTNEESSSDEPFHLDKLFESFDEMVQYNIDWINNKIENNVISETFGFANNGGYPMEPVIVNKEIMVKLNKLGFLTAGSQGGIVMDDYKERAYIYGYIKTDTAKKLYEVVNLNDKIFQYTPLSIYLGDYISDDMQYIFDHQRIPVTFACKMGSQKCTYGTRVGVHLFPRIRKYISQKLNTEFLGNYSFCVAIDPVHGRLFDDKENGLVTKLCQFLEEMN